MTNQTTYPLRLPRSVRTEVERLAKQDGVSINQFVATAVAEKVTALNTADYFAIRKSRADVAAFDRVMRRKGGEPPRAGDELARTRPPKAPGKSARSSTRRRIGT
jgi:hypothetical protein